MRAQYLFHQEGDGARARASMAEALAAGRAARDPAVLADVVVCAALLGMAHWDVDRQALLVEELDALGPEVRHRDGDAGVVGRGATSTRARAPTRRPGSIRGAPCSIGDARRAHGGDRGSTDSATSGPAWPTSSMVTRPWRERPPVEALRAGEPDRNLLASRFGQLTPRGAGTGRCPATRWHRAARRTGRMGSRWPAAWGALDGDRGRPRRGSGAPAPDRHCEHGRSSTTRRWARSAPRSSSRARSRAWRCRPSSDEELARFAGQLIVISWGVDVVGAADRFLAVLAVGPG